LTGLMSSVKGPDICHQPAQCLPSTGWKSAIDRLIKEILASWQAHFLVNWLDQVRLG
jgi:hypothetical protein